MLKSLNCKTLVERERERAKQKFSLSNGNCRRNFSSWFCFHTQTMLKQGRRRLSETTSCRLPPINARKFTEERTLPVVRNSGKSGIEWEREGAESRKVPTYQERGKNFFSFLEVVVENCLQGQRLRLLFLTFHSLLLLYFTIRRVQRMNHCWTKSVVTRTIWRILLSTAPKIQRDFLDTEKVT